MQTYSRQSPIPCPVEPLGMYHFRTGALDRLLPPWSNVEILCREPLVDGARVELAIHLLGLRLRYIAEHRECRPPHFFADFNASTNLLAKLVSWHHEHRFESVSATSCLLHDEVHFELRFALRFMQSKILSELEKMFDYRHQLTTDDLALNVACPGPLLRVGITGSAGLIGRRLSSLLSVLGHEVVPLRRSPSGDDRGFDPWHAPDAVEKLQKLDAVVHLAGRPIMAARWTKKVKRAIHDSRVDLTMQLAQQLARVPNPPRVFLSGSAIGYYGDCGDRALDETCEPERENFLSEVARQWEDATMPASLAGIRTVKLRTGIVLDPRGGALKQMLLPAKLALSGPLGDGRQWLSWITLDDCVGGIYYALMHDTVRGPVNLVSPTPVTNREFAKTLGSVLHRPVVIPVPKLVLRLPCCFPVHGHCRKCCKILAISLGMMI